jgi:hypothetical protein
VLTVEESIVINKPRLEVWEFMTDPANVPVYSSNVVEYELVSGEKQEVGRICRWVVKVAGRRLEMTDEMVEVERDAAASTNPRTPRFPTHSRCTARTRVKEPRSPGTRRWNRSRDSSSLPTRSS